MTLIFLILLFCVLTVLLTKLLTPRITELYIRNMLITSSESDPKLISKLLRSFMPTGSVFSDISLPIPGKDGEEIAYGTVAINRGGIFLISRICGDGLLENPPSADKWKLMSCGSVTEFTNPFRDQDAPRRLLAYYANAAGVSNIKVHSLLVYTNSLLRFSYPPSKGVISARSLYRRLRGISKRGKLSLKDIRSITSLLREVDAGNIDAPI